MRNIAVASFFFSCPSMMIAKKKKIRNKKQANRKEKLGNTLLAAMPKIGQSGVLVLTASEPKARNVEQFVRSVKSGFGSNPAARKQFEKLRGRFLAIKAARGGDINELSDDMVKLRQDVRAAVAERTSWPAPDDLFDDQRELMLMLLGLHLAPATWGESPLVLASAAAVLEKMTPEDFYAWVFPYVVNAPTEGRVRDLVAQAVMTDLALLSLSHGLRFDLIDNVKWDQNTHRATVKYAFPADVRTFPAALLHNVKLAPARPVVCEHGEKHKPVPDLVDCVTCLERNSRMTQERYLRQGDVYATIFGIGASVEDLEDFFTRSRVDRFKAVQPVTAKEVEGVPGAPGPEDLLRVRATLTGVKKAGSFEALSRPRVELEVLLELADQNGYVVSESEKKRLHGLSESDLEYELQTLNPRWQAYLTSKQKAQIDQVRELRSEAPEGPSVAGGEEREEGETKQEGETGGEEGEAGGEEGEAGGQETKEKETGEPSVAGRAGGPVAGAPIRAGSAPPPMPRSPVPKLPSSARPSPPGAALAIFTPPERTLVDVDDQNTEEYKRMALQVETFKESHKLPNDIRDEFQVRNQFLTLSDLKKIAGLRITRLRRFLETTDDAALLALIAPELKENFFDVLPIVSSNEERERFEDIFWLLKKRQAQNPTQLRPGVREEVALLEDAVAEPVVLSTILNPYLSALAILYGVVTTRFSYESEGKIFSPLRENALRAWQTFGHIDKRVDELTRVFRAIEANTKLPDESDPVAFFTNLKTIRQVKLDRSFVLSPPVQWPQINIPPVLVATVEERKESLGPATAGAAPTPSGQVQVLDVDEKSAPEYDQMALAVENFRLSQKLPDEIRDEYQARNRFVTLKELRMLASLRIARWKSLLAIHDEKEFRSALRPELAQAGLDFLPIVSSSKEAEFFGDLLWRFRYWGALFYRKEVEAEVKLLEIELEKVPPASTISNPYRSALAILYGAVFVRVLYKDNGFEFAPLQPATIQVWRTFAHIDRSDDNWLTNAVKTIQESSKLPESELSRLFKQLPSVQKVQVNTALLHAAAGVPLAVQPVLDPLLPLPVPEAAG